MPRIVNEPPDFGINFSKCPPSSQDGMRLYIIKGILPEPFLTKVLENNLVGSFAAADDFNLGCMFAYANFLYNELPRGCWGSREVVRNWPGIKEKYFKDDKATV